MLKLKSRAVLTVRVRIFRECPSVLVSRCPDVPMSCCSGVRRIRKTLTKVRAYRWQARDPAATSACHHLQAENLDPGGPRPPLGPPPCSGRGKRGRPEPPTPNCLIEKLCTDLYLS